MAVIYQLAFSWNSPTAAPPNPAGQTLYSDSSNNIGIGTLSPGAKMEIYSTSSDSVLKLSRQSATSTLFKLGTDSALIINNNNSDVLSIKNGNVGIGTTNPQATLDVNGTIRGATYGFGGMYTTNPGPCSSNNPLTGAQSCPALFTAYEVGRFQHGGGIGACEWTLSILYACIR